MALQEVKKLKKSVFLAKRPQKGSCSLKNYLMWASKLLKSENRKICRFMNGLIRLMQLHKFLSSCARKHIANLIQNTAQIRLTQLLAQLGISIEADATNIGIPASQSGI
jgi:hypothetical protein